MAKYYKTKLLPSAVPVPPPGPLTGLQDMKLTRFKAVLDAQDQLPGLGRRIVARQGLKGQAEWLAVDTGTLPHPTTNRVTLRAFSQLSTGCFYDLSVIYIPSGETDEGPTGGNIDVEITWASGLATESDQFQLELEGSTETNGAEPDGAGELWGAMRHVLVTQIRPDGLGVPATLDKWTKAPVTASITLENIGGCRIVDACLFEVPFRTQWEADNATHMITTHSASGVAPWVPVTRHNETTPDGDPRGGPFHLMDVHHAQIKRFGPILFHWTSYTEDGTAAGDAEDGNVTTTSATYVGLVDVTHTSWSSADPGWSVGNYAHGYTQNENTLVMRGKNGAIPVRVQVYGNASSGTGTVKIQTAVHSYIEVDLDSASDGWFDAYGWLGCGVGPEDHVVAQAFMKTTAGTLTVRDILVEYDMRGAP